MTARTTSVDIGSERAFAVLMVVVSLVVFVAVLKSERSSSEEKGSSRDSAPEERSESK